MSKFLIDSPFTFDEDQMSPFYDSIIFDDYHTPMISEDPYTIGELDMIRRNRRNDRGFSFRSHSFCMPPHLDDYNSTVANPDMSKVPLYDLLCPDEQ